MEPRDAASLSKEDLVTKVRDMEASEGSRVRDLEMQLAALQAAYARKEARIAEMRDQAKAFLAKRMASVRSELTAVTKERDELRDAAAASSHAATTAMESKQSGSPASEVDESGSESKKKESGDEEAAARMEEELAMLRKRCESLQAQADTAEDLQAESDRSLMQQQARAMQAESRVTEATLLVDRTRSEASKALAKAKTDLSEAHAAEISIVREAAAASAMRAVASLQVAEETAASAKQQAEEAVVAAKKETQEALSQLADATQALGAARDRERVGAEALLAERSLTERLRREIATAKQSADNSAARADKAEEMVAAATAAAGSDDADRSRDAESALAVAAELRADVARERVRAERAEAASDAAGVALQAKERLYLAAVSDAERLRESSAKAMEEAVAAAVTAAVVSSESAKQKAEDAAAESLRRAEKAESGSRSEGRRWASVRVELEASQARGEAEATILHETARRLTGVVLPRLRAMAGRDACASAAVAAERAIDGSARTGPAGRDAIICGKAAAELEVLVSDDSLGRRTRLRPMRVRGASSATASDPAEPGRAGSGWADACIESVRRAFGLQQYASLTQPEAAGAIADDLGTEGD